MRRVLDLILPSFFPRILSEPFGSFRLYDIFFRLSIGFCEKIKKIRGFFQAAYKTNKKEPKPPFSVTQVLLCYLDGLDEEVIFP